MRRASVWVVGTRGLMSQTHWRTAFFNSDSGPITCWNSFSYDWSDAPISETEFARSDVDPDYDPDRSQAASITNQTTHTSHHAFVLVHEPITSGLSRRLTKPSAERRAIECIFRGVDLSITALSIRI